MNPTDVDIDIGEKINSNTNISADITIRYYIYLNYIIKLYKQLFLFLG